MKRKCFDASGFLKWKLKEHKKTGNNKEISHSKQINKQTKQVAGRKWKAVVSRIATIYYVKYLIFNKKL